MAGALVIGDGFQTAGLHGAFGGVGHEEAPYRGGGPERGVRANPEPPASYVQLKRSKS
ncbi:hypothetical protein CU044_6427 [Streptomyces sp. L-9-10]|nr:hypothetical protein CU044_6427 [Streptomyces sp. L-9-10]